MKFQSLSRISLIMMAVLVLFLFNGADCGSGKTGVPSAFGYNAAIATMGGTYTSNVIDVNYYVSISSTREGTAVIPPGYGDVYTLVEYTTNGGVNYNLCHNTAGHPGDYLTFTEVPSTLDAVFHWDVNRDLGADASVENCRLRVRVFHAGDDPCSKAPQDVEMTNEFAIVLGAASICGLPPAITTEDAPDGQHGEAYSFQFEAVNGYGDLTWSLGTPIDETKVTGLTFSNTGLLSGTPMLVNPEFSAELTLDVWVDDSCPEGVRRDNQVYTILILPEEITCPPLSITTSSLPDGTEEEWYSHTLLYSGGYGAVSWSITLGGLPSGLTLNSTTGIISGTIGAETAGDYPLTIVATDSCPEPQSVSVSLTLRVEAAAPPVCAAGPEITSTALPDGQATVPYSYQLTATGGEGALSWSWNWPEGPIDGLNLSTSGLISGSPELIGTFNVQIIVTDSCWTEPQTDTWNTTIFIDNAPPTCAPAPNITSTELPNANEGTPFSYQLEASDGEGALTWNITSGVLPTGLTMDTDGLISGTADCGTSDEYVFMVEVVDSCDDPAPQSDSQEFTLIVVPASCTPPDILDGQTVPGGMELQSYFYAFQYTTGTGTHTWEITSGTLPDGITLDTANGMLTGNPATGSAGSYPLTVTVTDECPCNPQSDSFDFTLEIEELTVCFETPVEIHTFCLDCPESLNYLENGVVKLYFVFDGIQMPPSELALTIAYDSTKLLINSASITQGPNVMGMFSVIDGVDEFTINFNGTPLFQNMLFATIPVRNVFEGNSTGDLTQTIDSLKEMMGADLNGDVMDCSITLYGPD